MQLTDWLVPSQDGACAGEGGVLATWDIRSNKCVLKMSFTRIFSSLATERMFQVASTTGFAELIGIMNLFHVSLPI